MTESWTKEYELSEGNVSLSGWSFADESACKKYFLSRVKSKLLQGDLNTELREYLIEMSRTGFDTSALQVQIDIPPKAKDWEIGEAFAEVMLEDWFEASFPWQTSWDKRTPKASLPGPDLPGFQNKSLPRFLFGEIKSSSEKACPPQVVTKKDDGLQWQLYRLITSDERRLNLIGWLLVRIQQSPKWKPVFDEALKRYADDKAFICGVLVRGDTSPDPLDLAIVQEKLSMESSTFEVSLYVFHVPFSKPTWVELVYGKEVLN